MFSVHVASMKVPAPIFLLIDFLISASPNLTGCSLRRVSLAAQQVQEVDNSFFTGTAMHFCEGW